MRRDSIGGVDAIHAPRSSVSRETRLLFFTILISLVTLWALARLRFADRAVANPVTPVLTQLAPPPVFEQISTALSQAGSRLSSQVVAIQMQKPPSTGGLPETVAALIVDSGVAVAILSPAKPLTAIGSISGGSIIARDPASGLSVLRVSTDTAAGADPLFGRSMWAPRQPQNPRYLLIAEVAAESTSGRPVFVGALRPAANAVWGGTVWALPASADISPGSFVFTADGVFAGVVVEAGGGLILVSGDTLRETTGRLRTGGRREYGQLGVDVQPAPPEAIPEAGSPGSLIVTWVDPRGPAAGVLNATDVIVAVGGQPASAGEWQARTLRLAVDDTVELRVTGGGNAETVRLTAAPPFPLADPLVLGLSMRTVQRVGVEVLRVDPGSAAAQSGIQSGDIITAFGGRQPPTPADVRRIFARPAPDRPILVALTRGAAHKVVVIRKQ